MCLCVFQEIASFLISFDRHDEWLSCTLKTRSVVRSCQMVDLLKLWPVNTRLNEQKMTRKCQNIRNIRNSSSIRNINNKKHCNTRLTTVTAIKHSIWKIIIMCSHTGHRTGRSFCTIAKKSNTGKMDIAGRRGRTERRPERITWSWRFRAWRWERHLQLKTCVWWWWWCDAHTFLFLLLQCLYGCYVHSSIVPTFHRRCYWLLQVSYCEHVTLHNQEPGCVHIKKMLM